MIIYLFMIVLNARSSALLLPVRASVRSELKISATRFHWSTLLPGGIHTSRTLKHVLRTDWPADPVDDLIEKIPVSFRIEVLNQLTNAINRSKMAWYIGEMDFRQPDSELKNYLHHMVSNTFMEFELLQIFFEYVFSRPPKSATMDEVYEGISALPLTQILRAFALKNWNSNVDFLSPRMLADWSEFLHTSGEFRTQMSIEQMRNFQTNSKINPRTLVYLEPATWRKLFQKRLNRLKLTGYEDIEL